ncbi:MAG: hypothetical protein HFJ20_00155, partial [Clostridia bacterium]|nr:hypothetical protein [Clostridia bacterium]
MGLLLSKLKITTNKNKEIIIDITYNITEIAKATNATIAKYRNLYLVIYLKTQINIKYEIINIDEGLTYLLKTVSTIEIIIQEENTIVFLLLF